MENKLINIQDKNIITTINEPKTFVDSLSLEQACQILTIIRLWTRDSKSSEKTNFIKALENKVFESTLNDFNVELFNNNWKATIVRSKDSTKIVKNKTINYDEAINYAKNNNLEIPTKVDYEKLELMEWFQENADKFVSVEYKETNVKSSNNIRFKEIKKGE